jgi:single-strand DNA-binding protein
MLIGHAVADPEVKKTETGKNLSTFSLATNRDWVDSSGKKHESADFHRIVAWQKLGEICGKYVEKGKALFIEGRLTNRSYKNKQGETKYITEIVADNLNFLSIKKDKISVDPIIEEVK